MSKGEDVTSEDPALLWAEIARLRATIARLERQVGELDRLAHHDPLVPLPNRRGFERQLAGLIDRLERYGDAGALLFIDVDGLKMVNDSFGHDAGDAALIHVAELLVGGVRQSGHGGPLRRGRIAVLLERVDLAQANETAGPADRPNRRHQLQLRRAAHSAFAAIGIAEIRSGDTPEAVLARADRAMYEQKAAA
jgi:diguanylate cyclase (GGDEF)-like protein